MLFKRSRSSWRKCWQKIGKTFLLVAVFLSFLSVPLFSTSLELSDAINEYVQGNDQQAREMFAEILRQNPDEPRARDFYQELGGNPDQYQIKEEDLSPETPESRSEEIGSDPAQEGDESEAEASEEETLASEEPGVAVEEVEEIEPEGEEPFAYDTSEVEIVGEPLAEIEAEDLDTDIVPEFDPLEEEELEEVQREERQAEELEGTESGETKRFYTEEPVSPPSGMEVIHGVEVESFDEFIRITIEATGGLSYLTSRIYNPPMIVVDIPNTIPDLPQSPLSVGMFNIRRIRHSQYRIDPVKTTRVVVDLDQWVDNYEIYRLSPGNKIIVDVYEKELPPEVEPTVVEPDTPFEDIEELPEEVQEQIEVVSGEQQEVKVTEEAAEPLVVEVRDEEGEPLREENVVFEVVEGEGLLGEEGGEFSGKYEIKTDEQGRAELTFIAVEQAGPTVVEARVPGLEDLSVDFNLVVEPCDAVELVKISGDRQEARRGELVRESLVVEARDQYGNPVPDVRVHYIDRSGKGVLQVDRSQDDLTPEGVEVKISSGPDGRAVVDSYRVPGDERTARVTAQAKEDLIVEFELCARSKILELELYDEPLENVLYTLAEIADWNIVIPPEVEGEMLSDMRVSINLDEVSALRALDTILAMHDLARVSDGNVIRIVSAAQVRREGVPVVEPEEIDLHPGSNMVTVQYSLSFLDEAQRLASDLRGALMSEEGEVFADDRRNAIVVTDYARNQRQLKKVIEGIDQPDERFDVTVIRLQYRDPEQLREEIDQLLPTGRGEIVANIAANSLLIYSDPTLLSRIELLVDKLDAPGVISDHFRFVEMEGYDVEQIADQVTAILGGQAIDLDEIDVDVDIEDPGDLEDLRIEREIEDYLNQVTIVPVETLESILLFAPPEIQEIAIEMMEAMKRRPGEYIDDRHWRWVSVHNIHFEEAASLIDRMGGITIQTTIPAQAAFLLSSTEPAYLDRLEGFLEEVDRDIEVDDGREIITYTPRQVEPDQLGDDLEDYYEDMHEFYDDELEERPRVLYAEEDLLVLVVSQNEARFIRRLLEKLEEMATVDHEVLTYSPRFVDASDLASELDDRNIGRILYEGDHRFSILIPQDNIEYYRKLIEEVDSPQIVTNVYQLRNTRAEEIVETLQEAEGADVSDFAVSFSHDGPTNTIIYSTPQNLVPQVEELIKQLDQWQRQVFIEGIILEYTLDEEEQYGARWIFDPDQSPLEEDVSLVESGGGYLGGEEFHAILNQDQFHAVLRFMEEERETEIMAKPQISAINNRSAVFSKGQTEFYDEMVGPIGERVPEQRERDAVTMLSVTPTITRDRFVRMDLELRKDDFVGDDRRDENRIENSVLVQDGHTVVLGGLIEDEISFSEFGIPLLREIPVIGNLFKTSQETVSKNELIFFITPHVIEDPADAERTTRMISEQLHQITPVPINLNIDGIHQITRLEGLAEEAEEREQIARQIIEYREEVGPFLSLDDVLEVPAVDHEVLSELLAHEIELEVDVNMVTAEELMSIKNIDPDAAQALIEKRQGLEMIRDLEICREILIEHGVDPDFYDEYLEPVFTITSPALEERDFAAPEPDREEVEEELEELDVLDEDEPDNDQREQLPDLEQF